MAEEEGKTKTVFVGLFYDENHPDIIEVGVCEKKEVLDFTKRRYNLSRTLMRKEGLTADALIQEWLTSAPAVN